MKKLNLHSLRNHFLFLLAAAFIFTHSACQPYVSVQKEIKQPPAFQPPRQISPPPKYQAPEKVLAEELDSKSALGIFQKEIYGLLMKKKFDAVEKMVAQTREKKERMTDGDWKLEYAYQALTNMYAERAGQEVSDKMWEKRIEILKQWKESSPQSITARVALAKAYTEYGWFARGDGYMNTVSEENRRLLAERTALAEKELLEARNLDAKCPQWYAQTLFVAMTNGWAAADFDRLFEEAINFEPNYIDFYMTKSENVTPKWGGKPGEWEKFVGELPGTVPEFKTDETNIIYFRVVAGKLKDYSINPNFAMLSKERIKQGFADLEKKFGANNYRLNQFAYMTVMLQDFPAAEEAFNRIGNNRDKDVWSEKTFNLMKQLPGQKEQIARR